MPGESTTSLNAVLGSSEGMAGLRAEIARLLEREGQARRLPPVLRLGDTGKGHVARAVHRASARAKGAGRRIGIDRDLDGVLDGDE